MKKIDLNASLGIVSLPEIKITNLNKSNYYSFTWKDENGKETVLSLGIKK